MKGDNFFAPLLVCEKLIKSHCHILVVTIFFRWQLFNRMKIYKSLLNRPAEHLNSIILKKKIMHIFFLYSYDFRFFID